MIACAPAPGDRGPEALYARYCARCHGDDGRGDAEKNLLNPGLDLTASDWAADGARTEIHERIADGHGSMPGFAKRLSEDELEGLVELVLGMSGGREVP